MIDRFVIKIIDEGMLTMKKLFALMLALAMMLTVVCAFAEGEGGEGGGETGGETGAQATHPPVYDSVPSITIQTTSNADEAAKDETAYTWYRILEAEVGADPTSQGANNESQSGGRVSYYTDSQTKADALTGTGLFNVTRVGTSSRWYVELKDPNTQGAAIAEELGKLDLATLFPHDTFNQTAVAGTATSGTVAPGYYYVESTAGKNVAVQTLTAVTITEKNEFPTVEKKVVEADENAQIGDDITFTLKVKVPSTANDTIVLTDTMTAGLSFKSIDSVKMGGTNGTEVSAGETTYSVTPAANNAGFTLSFTKPFVISAAAQADSGTKYTEIEIICTAILDGDAQTATPEKNQVVLDYGQHYTTKPKTAEVSTYEFKFEKIDGTTKEELAGAEFQLLLDGTPMDLIEVTAGKEYRIALPNEEGRTQTITTNGETVRIYGLDTDINSYSLQETKAPTGGYNILKTPTSIKATAPAAEGEEEKITKIENNQGTVLPSTGGSGTTIFYVIGGLLIIGAAVVLVARRKAQE